MRSWIAAVAVLLATFAVADIDTKDGTAITTATLLDGSAQGKADGQTITAGASCATQSVDYSRTTDNANDNFLTSHTQGMSWTSSAFGAGTKDVYSVTLRLSAAESASSTITMRFDDDADMSAEYLAEGSVVCAGNGATPVTCEIVFASRPTISQSTAYYYFIHNTGGTSYSTGLDENQIGATSNGVYYYDNGSGANWAPTLTADYDHWFEVRTCD